MNIYSIFDKDSCIHNVTAKNKDAVLRIIAKTAFHSKALEGANEEIIYQELKKREGEGSTGFGNGIAIPHARIKGLKKFILFVLTSSKGVDFEAIDNKKVQIIFVLLGPAEEFNIHLKVLATISRILAHTNAKKEMLKALSKNAIAESFLRYVDTNDKKPVKREKMEIFIVILYEDEYLYSILEYFIEEGIEGATILESIGMGGYISNIPIFFFFLGFLRENKNRSKTIIALIPKEKSAHII